MTELEKKNIKYKPFFVQSENPEGDRHEVAKEIVKELIIHIRNENTESNNDMTKN